MDDWLTGPRMLLKPTRLRRREGRWQAITLMMILFFLYVEKELVEVDINESYVDNNVRDSVVDETLNSILNDVDNSVIPWWMRRLTS